MGEDTRAWREGYTVGGRLIREVGGDAIEIWMFMDKFYDD